MDIHALLESCHGFQWDNGNSLKSWVKHKVSEGEAEQAFLNEPLLLWEDKKHSEQENRFWALGRTDQGRHLFVVFTIRKNLARIISARNMNRKEREAYEKFKTNT
jgi:uncharacterized DUF497 family protein